MASVAEDGQKMKSFDRKKLQSIRLTAIKKVSKRGGKGEESKSERPLVIYVPRPSFAKHILCVCAPHLTAQSFSLTAFPSIAKARSHRRCFDADDTVK